MLASLDSSTRSLSLAPHMSRILRTPPAGSDTQTYTTHTASMRIQVGNLLLTQLSVLLLDLNLIASFLLNRLCYSVASYA